MRVVVMGQAAFGEAVLKRLLEDGVEVVGVSAPPPAGPRPDPLWAAAEAANIPPVATATLKEPGGQAEWSALAPDLCVMAFVTDIIPASVLAMPRLGTIQYHPSLLPLHRGSSAINWAIIHQREETGLTIFWPDDGIDTGPVLLQKRCPIGPDDTVGSLYFNQLFPMGVDALAESVRLVAEGKAPRIEQDHALSTYEPPCRDEHGRIAWHERADRLYALIRGCNPQPGAWAMAGDQKVRFFDSQLLPPEPGMPGRVLRVSADGVDIRLNGGVLRAVRVQPDGEKKIPAAEWAESARIQAGFRLK